MSAPIEKKQMIHYAKPLIFEPKQSSLLSTHVEGILDIIRKRLMSGDYKYELEMVDKTRYQYPKDVVNKARFNGWNHFERNNNNSKIIRIIGFMRHHQSMSCNFDSIFFRYYEHENKSPVLEMDVSWSNPSFDFREFADVVHRERKIGFPNRTSWTCTDMHTIRLMWRFLAPQLDLEQPQQRIITDLLEAPDFHLAVKAMHY